MLVSLSHRRLVQDPATTCPPPGFQRARCLLLDLDNVLYDARCWWDWLVAQLERLGLLADSQSLFRVWEQDYLADVQVGAVDYWTQFRSFLKALGLRTGPLTEVFVAAKARHTHLLQRSRPFVQVGRTLQELKRQQWQLGLAASTILTPDETRDLLQQFRIHELLDVVVTSVEVGPDSRARGVAASVVQQLGWDPGHVAYVSQSPGQIQAARRADLVTIGFGTPASVKVMWRITHFEHLARIGSRPTLQRAA